MREKGVRHYVLESFDILDGVIEPGEVLIPPSLPKRQGFPHIEKFKGSVVSYDDQLPAQELILPA
jgi:hypothetical protein